MLNILKRGSSPIDWCEKNYAVSPAIAEFVNTLSNLIFLLVSPLLMYLYRDYGNAFNQGIHLIWTSFFAIGLASAYFHSTLSLLGQLLDELSILWCFFIGFAMFFPKRLYPGFVRNDRKLFALFSLVLGTASTILAIIHPAFNALALMVLMVPTIIVLIYELKRENNARVLGLGFRCLITWSIAMICWITDWFMCDVWTGVKFAYLHAMWHVLICITSYIACALFAYFSTKEGKAGVKPVLLYWPRNDFALGIPYVGVRACKEIN